MKVWETVVLQPSREDITMWQNSGKERGEREINQSIPSKPQRELTNNVIRKHTDYKENYRIYRSVSIIICVNLLHFSCLFIAVCGMVRGDGGNVECFRGERNSVRKPEDAVLLEFWQVLLIQGRYNFFLIVSKLHETNNSTFKVITSQMQMTFVKLYYLTYKRKRYHQFLQSLPFSWESDVWKRHSSLLFSMAYSWCPF